MPHAANSIVIMHYHLKPGGVTSVIRDDLTALFHHAPWMDRVALATGSDEGLETFRARFAPELQSGRLEIRVVPELDYNSGCRDSAQESSVRAALAELRREGAVWWVHNYHLGKNPLFTEALLEVIERYPDQRVLLQIHDFPECGRYHNLELLRRCLTRDPYPQSCNVRYLTINARDHRLLLAAGVPPSLVWTLHNPAPVRADLRTNIDRTAIRVALASAFGGSDGQFDPHLPTAIYPVRTIRRKNAFEALLLNRVAQTAHNLVITLPGVSEPERRYSQLVKTAYREGLVTGLWGVGDNLQKAGLQFDELIAGSDLIVSSSVQEGFGYQFITPLTHRVALFARRLDVLQATGQLFDGFPHHFYEEVRVPWSSRRNPELHARTAQTYQQRFETIAAALPGAVSGKLEHELTQLLTAATAEFSYLAPLHQYRLVKEADGDHGYRRELRGLNRTLVEKLDELPQAEPPRADEPRTALLSSWFGLESVARGIVTVLESFENPGPQPDGEFDTEAGAARRFAPPGQIELRPLPGTTVGERLLYAFARLEHLRLLYD